MICKAHDLVIDKVGLIALVVMGEMAPRARHTRGAYAGEKGDHD